MLVTKLSQVPQEVHLRRPVQNCYRGPLRYSDPSKNLISRQYAEIEWPFAELRTFKESFISISRQVSLA